MNSVEALDESQQLYLASHSFLFISFYWAILYLNSTQYTYPRVIVVLTVKDELQFEDTTTEEEEKIS